MRKAYYALAASALMLALALSDARAVQDGHAHAPHDRTRQADASRSRRGASKARRRSARRAPVSYVCPMHPDMRSRTRGECPKCGMALVVAGRKATDAGASEGHSNP